MDEARRWRIVTGTVVLVLVVALLLSTPSMVFAKKIALIDTELLEAGPTARKVLTRFDLSDADELQRIPTTLGPWTMTEQHEWNDIATLLNTNVLLSREYSHPNLYQTANLLVVQSSNVSSFHPAPVCYRAQGWELPAGEGDDLIVHVPNASWAQPRWLSDAEPSVFGGNLSAKLLEAVKLDADGSVSEKRIALYVYLKGEDWRVTDSVTWLRAEIEVPASATAMDAAPALSLLLAEALPTVFSFQTEEEATLAESLARDHGAIGIAGIAALLGLPGGLVVFEGVRLARSKRRGDK